MNIWIKLIITLSWFSGFNSTLTKPVGFKDCLLAIKDNAFLASDYPVIITIENHLGAELQKKAAMVSFNLK
jgi:hypothetical protein